MKIEQSKDYLFSVESEYSIKIVRIKAKSEKLAKEIIAEEYSTCNAALIEYNESEIEEVYSFHW